MISEEHSKFSASGAHRWTKCPASIRMEQGVTNYKSTAYADEGHKAHYFAACLLGSVGLTPAQLCDSAEMTTAVKVYIDYVQSIEGKLYIEQRVDYDNIVEGGFGTPDAIVINDSELHVIDLKYGKGMLVHASSNYQLILYAIGAMNTHKPDVKTVHMHICQPRMNNISTWIITMDELVEWEQFFRQKAIEASDPNAKFNPCEDACKFCKAKGQCKALFQFVQEKLFNRLNQLKNVDNMNDEELKLVLDNAQLISLLITAVKEKVASKLKVGERFDGYKLVEKRSMTKYIDDLERVEKVLVEQIGNEAYEKKLVPITRVRKLVSSDILDTITEKHSKKLELVSENDPRPSINMIDIFDSIEVTT